MATCNKCESQCVVRVSKSQTNPEREFYSCPGGCKGWIGWVDETSIGEKSATVGEKSATAAVKAVQAAQATKIGTQKCPTCAGACIPKTSNTEKTRGKEFWSCKNRCKAWIGWVSNVGYTAPIAPVNPVTPAVITANETKTSVVSSTVPMINYHCEQCDKILNVKQELNFQVKRRGHMFVDIADLKLELEESITNGDYTCENCISQKSGASQ